MHEKLNQQMLAVRTSELERQIGNGIRKSDGGPETEPPALTRKLDEYLIYGAELYRTLAQASTGVRREEYGVKAVQFLKAKNGSYHKEKANFCIDQANYLRLTTEAFETQETEEAGPFVSQPDDKELATRFRMQAAHWLRMSAACLEMPGEGEQ